MRYVLTALLLSSLGLSAQGLVNGDLEKGTPGSTPQGWTVPSSHHVSWISTGCKQGNGCAEFQLTGPEAGGSGNMMQMFSAEPFRGKQIRYRAAVNVAAGARAALWLRVDRPDGVMGFFDNMSDRPIATQGEWRYFEITGVVQPDAVNVALGILASGGTILFDDASLTATGDADFEPARPLTDNGLANLLSFTRLFGIVRHFHPSDEAAAADWDRIAIAGTREIETAANPAERVRILKSIFEPVAPTLRIFIGADPDPPAALAPTGDELSVVRWHNRGFAAKNPQNTYRRELVRSPRASWSKDDIYRIDLGQGVQALVPLAVFADAQGTLPHRAASVARPAVPFYSAESRATRLGDIVLMWNILKHFYPYFDIARAKWDDVLPVALREAAADTDGEEFRDSLAKMVAALEDGHGRVLYRNARPLVPLPLTASWIEGKFIVTSSTTESVKPGDEIVAINRTPAKDALETAEKLISGATPQWKRARSSSEVLTGIPGRPATLTIRHFGATQPEQLDLHYPTNPNRTSLTDPRPKSVITELEPSIWYVDLTRAQDQEIRDRLTQLAAAKGIVFDMRGYPRVSIEWFRYVTQSTMRSAQWHVPLVDRPGDTRTELGGWDILPAQPYLAGKKVFLTNGTAISYAETTMGIIENYKLGAIVGETTAGTNGNVNPVELPGGYTVVWTGMKVLKHDGSRHHGVGIAPTVPVSRTQAGVAAGRDEVLERGLSLLRN